MPLPPGLEGYVLADQQRNQNNTNMLAQMNSMLQIQQSQRQAQSTNALLGVMKNLPKKADGSFDMQAAVPQLLQAGPAGLDAVNHLVKVNESLNNQRMMEQLNGGGGTPGQPPSPEVLDMLALKAGIGGHPGAATLSRVADARRVQQQNVQAVDAMKSAPGVTPNTPNDDSGNPMPVIPAKPGIFAALAGSKYPEVSQSAQALQQQIDQGAPGMTPQQINAHADRLTSLNSSRASTDAVQAAVTARNDKNQNIRVQIHNTPAGGAGAGPTLGNDALDIAASRYLQDGTLPPNLGRGTQGARNTQVILDRAAAMAKAKGMDGEAARISQVSNKAIGQALGQLEKQRANVMTYEKTALAGADIALEMSSKVDRTGSPVINKWINAGRVAITGDPDVTRLNNAVETFSNEYAKVMSGSSGGQATTVSMQQHAREMLSSKMNPAQFKGAIDLMKREMTQTREKAFDAQIDEMKGRMSSVPSATSPAPQRRASDKAPASSGWSVKVVQ